MQNKICPLQPIEVRSNKSTNKIEICISADGMIHPQGVELAESFILNWEKRKDQFRIDLDLCFGQNSPFYKTPKPDEYSYYRKGYLTFYGVKTIKGFVALKEVAASLNPDGTKDWDALYDFQRIEKGFKFVTDFTELEVECEGFEMRVADENGNLFF